MSKLNFAQQCSAHIVTNMHVGEFHSTTSVCCCCPLNHWGHQGTHTLLKGIYMELTHTNTLIFLVISQIDKIDKLTTFRETTLSQTTRVFAVCFCGSSSCIALFHIQSGFTTVIIGRSVQDMMIIH